MFGGSPHKIKKSARRNYELIPGKKPSVFSPDGAVEGCRTPSIGLV
jgi:hypothetical protein